MQNADFNRLLRLRTADVCRATQGNECGGREEGSN